MTWLKGAFQIVRIILLKYYTVVLFHPIIVSLYYYNVVLFHLIKWKKIEKVILANLYTSSVIEMQIGVENFTY